MPIGRLAILGLGKRRAPPKKLQTTLHGIVPIIAASSYFAMAIGQGAIVLPTVDAHAGLVVGRVFYFARYFDWAFTTPRLLVSLVLSAMHGGQKRAGVILSDVLMIATAFFGASGIAAWKWTRFLISCIAFLGVHYVIRVSAMDADRAQRSDVRWSCRREAVLLSVAWLVYPLVLLVAPDGLGVVSGTVGVVAIAILDTPAKVVIGLMSIRSDAAVTARDLGEVPAVGTAYDTRTRATV